MRRDVVAEQRLKVVQVSIPLPARTTSFAGVIASRSVDGARTCARDVKRCRKRWQTHDSKIAWSRQPRGVRPAIAAIRLLRRGACDRPFATGLDFGVAAPTYSADPVERHFRVDTISSPSGTSWSKNSRSAGSTTPNGESIAVPPPMGDAIALGLSCLLDSVRRRLLRCP